MKTAKIITACAAAFYAASCAGAPASVLGGGDFLYTANRNGGVTITAYRGHKKNIIIPETVNGLPVNVIGRGAFAGKGITGVDIPAAVTAIEDGAFMNNKLRNVKLPVELKSIGDEAFKRNRLETVNLREGITEIGFRAFEKNRLAEITLPLSLKKSGDYCFAGNRIKSAEFSEGMDAVPAGMFAQNGIVILRLPETVRLLGAGAFAGNPVEAVSFWGGEYVGKDAFADTNIKVIGIAENARFDSPREISPGFQNAYKSMGGASGIYYKRDGNVWWVKED